MDEKNKQLMNELLEDLEKVPSFEINFEGDCLKKQCVEILREVI
jgi:hypothetical protein